MSSAKLFTDIKGLVCYNINLNHSPPIFLLSVYYMFMINWSIWNKSCIVDALCSLSLYIFTLHCVWKLKTVYSFCSHWKGFTGSFTEVRLSLMCSDFEKSLLSLTVAYIWDNDGCLTTKMLLRKLFQFWH